MNLEYRNIFKAMTLFSSVQGLNILLYLVRTKLVALFLGPAGVGLSSIYSETKELIHESSNMGMDQSGVREISVAYEQWKTTGDREALDNSIMLVRSWELLLSVVGILICFLFAYPLSVYTFDDTEHVVGYMTLSPAVGMATVICGEMTILKSLRKLKSIALLSSVNIALGMFINVPLYYFFGVKGIIPALLLFSLCQMLIVMRASYKEAPLRVNFMLDFLKRGKPMLVLGGAFVLQGFLLHGVNLAIQSSINKSGGLADVGLYTSASIILTMYYGIFSSSMEADYFPRLSGVFSDIKKRCATVHRQINALQMFAAPMFIAFLVGIHLIIPLLLSSEFVGTTPIVEIVVISCLATCVCQPMAFLPLAAGDSKLYLFIDIIGFLFMYFAYTLCYQRFGLIGIAYGMAAYNIFNMLWTGLCVKIKYGVMPSALNVIFFILQFALAVATYYIIKHTEGVTYWASGTVMTLCSAALSYVLYKKIRREE